MNNVYVLTLHDEIGGPVYLVGVFESEPLAVEAMHNIINEYSDIRLSSKNFDLNRTSMNKASDIGEYCRRRRINKRNFM